MKFKVDPNKQQDKVYGATTLGARGQIVIPIEARKDLGLKPGDQLMVLGKYNKALGLIKADEINDIIKIALEAVEGSKSKQEMLKYIQQVFGNKA